MHACMHICKDCYTGNGNQRLKTIRSFETKIGQSALAKSHAFPMTNELADEGISTAHIRHSNYFDFIDQLVMLRVVNITN
ncbi:unnamed protein product [Brugia pahangi]|uniref:DUF4372 domain-containing protein n=1 Tax=Brugia pahangi TaxID=6280 RepID=A0A0N4TVT0_BRUPA|nr:unnamed protein product [Brugia pahangi]